VGKRAMAGILASHNVWTLPPEHVVKHVMRMALAEDNTESPMPIGNPPSQFLPTHTILIYISALLIYYSVAVAGFWALWNAKQTTLNWKPLSNIPLRRRRTAWMVMFYLFAAINFVGPLVIVYSQFVKLQVAQESALEQYKNYCKTVKVGLLFFNAEFSSLLSCSRLGTLIMKIVKKCWFRAKRASRAQC
jgi:hypothetical protein